MQILLVYIMVFLMVFIMKNIGNTYNIYKIHYIKRKIKEINRENDTKYIKHR